MLTTRGGQPCFRPVIPQKSGKKQQLVSRKESVPGTVGGDTNSHRSQTPWATSFKRRLGAIQVDTLINPATSEKDTKKGTFSPAGIQIDVIWGAAQIDVIGRSFARVFEIGHSISMDSAHSPKSLQAPASIHRLPSKCPRPKKKWRIGSAGNVNHTAPGPRVPSSI